MAIIGRKEEIRELEKCEKSKKSELICVYGRRRVGKTYLVEQTYADYFAFRATGVESGNTRTQLKSFKQRLAEAGDKEKRIPANWFEAFSRLEKVLSAEETKRSVHGKKIVFFDEFPWFATARSDFLEAFGEFWNRCGTVNRDYVFIICGSATSWIIKNVLEDSGSLYNRVTSQIFLRPFSLKETEMYMQDREFGWSRRQIAECQMVFGGLPYFFSLLNPDESLNWNIDALIFKPHALLRHESKKLLEATLKKSAAYNAIMVTPSVPGADALFSRPLPRRLVARYLCARDRKPPPDPDHSPIATTALHPDEGHVPDGRAHSWKPCAHCSDHSGWL